MSQSPQVPDGLIPYARFRREVQRYAGDPLLRLVAREGAYQAQMHANDQSAFFKDATGRETYPWALIEIARQILVGAGLGNGGRLPTPADLRKLCIMHGNLADPIVNSQPGGLQQMLVRLAFEQFRWQISEFEELARTHALYVDTPSSMPRATEFTPSAWRTSLGCSIEELVSVTFLWFVGSTKHEGRVDLAWIDQENFDDIRAAVDGDLIRDITRTHLSATPAQIRRLDPDNYAIDSGVFEHRFNPLEARPLVVMRDESLLAPHPLLVIRRAGATGIYYDRCQDRRFTDQLGDVFEEYVGRNLRLITAADVHHEPPISKGENAVDWIVVLPEVVWLVEAKATRMRADARAGLPSLEEDLERTIGKAYRQIDRTAELIRSRHPSLQFVPPDRPLHGLVVTLEPYWAATGGASLLSDPATPTIVSSARELEAFCAAAQSVSSRVLLDAIGSLEPLAVGDLGRAAIALGNTRNPILEASWEALFAGWDAAVSQPHPNT